MPRRRAAADKADEPTTASAQPPAKLAAQGHEKRIKHINDLSDGELLHILKRFKEGKDVSRLSAVSRKWRRVAAQVPAIVIPASASSASVTSFLRGKSGLEHLTIPHHVACCGTASFVLGPWCELVPALKGLKLVSPEQKVQPALFVSVAAALQQLENFNFTGSSDGIPLPHYRGIPGPFRLNHLRMLHLPQVSAEADFLATILRSCPSLVDLSISLPGSPGPVSHSKLQKLKYKSVDMSCDSLTIDVPDLLLLETENVMNITATVSPNFKQLTLSGDCASCKVNPLPSKLQHLQFSTHAASSLVRDICNMVYGSCGSLKSVYAIPDKWPFSVPTGTDSLPLDAEVFKVWKALIHCRYLTCLAVDWSHLTSSDLVLERFPHLECVYIAVNKLQPFFCPQACDFPHVTWREAVDKLDPVESLQKVVIMHRDESLPSSFANELLWGVERLCGMKIEFLKFWK